VLSTAGVELQAAKSTTIYAKTTLSAATLIDATSFTLSAGATTLVKGDRLKITNGAGIDENAEVLSYASSTRTVTLSEPLRYAHASGENVYGLFATVTIDTRTSYLKGQEVVCIWSFPVSDFIIRELASIGVSLFHVANFEERFANLHPREYAALMGDERLLPMLDESVSQLSTDLRLRGIYLERVVNTDLLIPCLVSKLRWLTLLNGDASYDTERSVAQAEFLRQFELLCSAPIWEDLNQDSIKSDLEVQDHQQFFERGL
jgi:hypothetical protein